MARKVFVHFLPEFCQPLSLQGGIAVVIDVIRASTTIVHAITNGAIAVRPCSDVAEAFRVASAYGRDRVLLGGERGGRIIEGFNLGNSPLEYTPEAVQGKIIVFTTSHGTKALARAHTADQVFIGCFNNLSAVLNTLSFSDKSVHFVCAGANGLPNFEDVLCAGVFAQRLGVKGSGSVMASDQVRIALSLAEGLAPNCEHLDEVLMSTVAGRHSVSLGMGEDIRIVSKLDLLPIIPELDKQTLCLRASDYIGSTSRESS